MKWGGEGPWKKIHFKGRTWPKRKNDFKGEGCDLRWNFALLVFNIYVLAVVTTIISSVRKVITNDQRLTEHSRLYISNTLLSILAVPNKALFCITPTLLVMLSFPIHLSNSAETLPRAPIILQGQFLHFSISTIFWSLFSNSGTFPVFLFLFHLPLHQLVQQCQ